MSKPREWWIKQGSYDPGSFNDEFYSTVRATTFEGGACVVEKSAYDAMTAKKEHFETLYKTTVVDSEMEIVALRAENERLKKMLDAHIEMHAEADNANAELEELYLENDLLRGRLSERETSVRILQK